MNASVVYVGIAVFCGITFFLITLAGVFLTIKKLDPALRLAAARRFKIEIGLDGKGQWRVLDSIAWYKGLAIELIQLLLYISLFLLWSVAAIGLVLSLAFFEKAL